MTHPFSRTYLAISHVKKVIEEFLMCEFYLLRCRLYLNNNCLEKERSRFWMGNQEKLCD